ncbi:TetR/AcrR family transcriptional regulator [Actinokineospora spheciospongiae]|uniref:TetR/AcrR family transcriptional regulator n=1 Tax=Actinokineospora spheciospongiae TaxID=909613 RepID=UPI000D713790|nr:TetR/AcrR family transcriptional regulator [Actinokineospora spheciospongiae]PWW63378.1 TetR family transcriptional regulator [Actinokineospora spheciospongiae]
MPRKAGRSAEDTRRALLDAAGAAVRARGVSASLDDIARQAGVSKGGLLHHFASKDELVRALAEDLLAGFRADVTAAVNPADTAPGALTRAYVRVCADFARDDVAVHELQPLIGHLSTIPEVAEIARADARRWRDDLRADGLPDHITALVVAAADGISAAPDWSTPLDDSALRGLETLLLALTTDTRLWDHLDVAPGQLPR